MAETGIFGHDDGRRGARISLMATNGTHRVWLGPRNDDEGGGIVKVYHSAAEEDGIPANLQGVARGRLYAVDVGGPDGVTAVLEIVGRNENWQDHPDVRLTIDGLRVHRRMPGRDHVAEFGIDETGGFLRLTSATRTIRLDTDGLHASVKDYLNEFVVPHPVDPGSEIHYVVIEGPEVGVFVRGTAELREGRAVVALPEHFAHVASPQGLTVQLTPRSADSRGVAATRLSVRELELVELGGGRGSYAVDWNVQGVRMGREDFHAVQPRRVSPLETTGESGAAVPRSAEA